MDIKIKILLIDDDSFLLGMYSMKFEKSNCEVKIATNGNDAFTVLKDGYQPDIILLDVVMPILDGFAVYESMKKEQLATHAMTIMLTNQGTEADLDHAKALGIDGYIIKASTIPSEVVTTVLDMYKKKKEV